MIGLMGVRFVLCKLGFTRVVLGPTGASKQVQEVGCELLLGVQATGPLQGAFITASLDQV